MPHESKNDSLILGIMKISTAPLLSLSYTIAHEHEQQIYEI